MPTSALGRAARLVAAAAGALLVAAALLGDLIASGDGTIGRTQLIALSLGALLLVLAAAGRRAADAHRATGVLLLNTLVLFLLLELAAAVLGRILPERGLEPEPRSSFYDSVAWGPQYLRDEARAVSRYHPYVAYRRAPLVSETINIDAAGIRSTPGSDCSPGAFTVYTFGGSTMWGHGSPDWGTIPAHLRRRIAEARGEPACIVNFGEGGFTSTQGVIELVRALQRRGVPDLVIFYDGVNDAVTAQLFGEPGLHWNMNRIARTFDDTTRLSGGTIGRLKIVQLARRLVPRRDAMDEPWRWHPTPPDSAEAMGRATAERYLQNVAVVEALAAAFGFRAEFFWQPHTLTGGKRLTAEEARMVALEQLMHRYPRFEALSAAASAVVADSARSRSALHDIRHIFDDHSGQVYVDWHHLTPEANDLVAARMIERILPPAAEESS